MDASPVVVITGASRGIGAAAARWLNKTRASVVLTARSREPLEALAREIDSSGGNALAVAADVSEPNDCRRVVEAALGRFGRLDSIVNNAGILEPLEKVAETDPAEWFNNIKVNLLGPVAMSMAALRGLRRHGGRIINVSSGAAYHVIEAASAYCAAKAALNHFSKVLAAEEPYLTVVAVRPGVVDTGMQEMLRRLGPSTMPPRQADYYRSLKEKNQLEPPAVPARAIAWLALHAPHTWSGAFMNYDDPQIAVPALEFFDNKL